MSDVSKKKKKNNKKIKKVKGKINKDIIDKIPTLDIPVIKTSYQMISSINSELDELSNNIKYNKIFNKNILSFPLFDFNFDYDKQDFEMKELINKANLYLSNNNLNKQIIKNYENKICQSNDYYIPRINNFNSNRNNEYTGFNNINYDSNFPIKNKNYLNKENIKKSFLNNLNKINKRKGNAYTNRSYYNSLYDTKMNRYRNNNSQRYILRNTLNNKANQKIKKLENLNLYINTNKRRPIVYTQIEHPRQTDVKLIPKMRNLSEKNKYLKYLEKNNRFTRINNDDKAIDILKEKI